MKTVLAIDPGTRSTGWCLLDYSRTGTFGFRRFGFIKPPTVVGEDVFKAHERAANVLEALEDELCEADIIVIEQPHHHRNTPSAENLRVLVQFVQATYTLLRTMPYTDDIVTYYPRQWKGTKPKSVTQNRVKLLVSKEQQAVLDSYPTKEAEDVYDAIGIAVYEVTKWKRKS